MMSVYLIFLHGTHEVKKRNIKLHASSLALSVSTERGRLMCLFSKTGCHIKLLKRSFKGSCDQQHEQPIP